MIKRIIRILSSVQLTVYLLFGAIVLIFFGTLDQVNIGIRGAQQKYFEHFFALWQYPAEWSGGEVLHWLHLPVLGGYLIGPLLLINLIVAHFRYYPQGWNKAGIIAIHVGIILLLISQLLTNILQEESRMWIHEGETANYTESFHDDELVLIDKTDGEKDRVISIPVEQLRRRPSIQHARLPFRVEVKSFLVNANIFTEADAADLSSFPANRGLGQEMRLRASPARPTFKLDERNRTTAVIELVGTEGSLGTWMVSNLFGQNNLRPQRFNYADREFEIALRFQRNYLPYTVELLDFTHDRYPGTDIPKNFSSKVRIRNSETGEDRQTLIYMNHPLRYEGLTFFQASFTPDDLSSMFQVVRNPGWLIPYLSCGLVSAGLLFQFGWHLVLFLRRHSL